MTNPPSSAAPQDFSYVIQTGKDGRLDTSILSRVIEMLTSSTKRTLCTCVIACIEVEFSRDKCWLSGFRGAPRIDDRLLAGAHLD
jgi:hypothetical protein